MHQFQYQKYDYCYWNHHEDDHDSFLSNLKLENSAENGITVLIETKREHSEAIITKAHQLINCIRDFYMLDYDKELVLLDKCYEDRNINKIMETYKLKDNKDESIMLELDILYRRSNNDFEQVIGSFINNKNLDKLSQKIQSINKTYEFVVSISNKLRESSSREITRTNIKSLFAKHLG